MIKEHSAVKHFKNVVKKYRGCIDAMLEKRSNDKRDSWQFLSENEMISILSKKMLKPSDYIYHDLVIATWGITKGIYQFDDDAFNAVAETEMNDKIPKDILLQLPEWSIYIESPNLTLYNKKIKGFFVYVIGDINPEYLLIVGDFGNSYDICVLSFAKETISEMLFDVLKKYKDTKEFNLLVSELNKIISLIIFICTQSQEINGTPQNPLSKKTKLGYRVEVKNTETFWIVGSRIGAAIRLSEQQRKEHIITNDITRNSPRPHIRRAHWHGVWHGKGKANYKVNWVAPTLVKVDIDLPAVIHKVKR